MSFDIHIPEQFLLTMDGDFALQMSPASLAVIREHLIFLTAKYKRPMDILEYGSGTSTVWFGKTFPEAHIISIEGDEEWFKRVSGWLKRENITNVDLRFVQQTPNWRDPDEAVNLVYLEIPQGPFDLIINDGGIREKVAETMMPLMDKLLKLEGLYIRHDYYHLVDKQWVGIGLSGNLDRITYEKFCVDHPEYSVITINGNGKWGVWGEFGGLCRKL